MLNNVVVLTDILLDHVTESVSDAAGDLSDALRDDAGHPLAEPAAELARSVLATFGLQFDTIADASRVLAAELLLALSEATSDEVLTDERRATARTLTRRILFTAYGEADLSSPEALDDTLSSSRLAPTFRRRMRSVSSSPCRSTRSPNRSQLRCRASKRRWKRSFERPRTS